MTDAGDLDALRLASGDMAYRRCSPDHHHHLVCRRCGRVVEVTDPPLEQWARDAASQYGFTAVSHHVELFGLCAQCTADPGNEADAG